MLTVGIAAVFIDRRRFSDLGLGHGDESLRRFLGGTTLGGAITLSAVIVGLRAGYYEFTGFEIATGAFLWVPVAIIAALFQLLFIVPEELLARGYLITNITESFEGVQFMPRSVGAGIGVLASSGFFYLTHAAGKGAVFGLMAGGLSLLLGLSYVFSGDLSIPIGIHFGFNFAGVLVGTNPQPASLLQITSRTTVQQSIALPIEALIVRLVAAVVSIGLVLWWFHRSDRGIRIAPALAKPVLRWRQDASSPGSNQAADP
jgi:membrane protease YdiL (CAAX protease family)